MRTSIGRRVTFRYAKGCRDSKAQRAISSASRAAASVRECVRQTWLRPAQDASEVSRDSSVWERARAPQSAVAEAC